MFGIAVYTECSITLLYHSISVRAPISIVAVNEIIFWLINSGIPQPFWHYFAAFSVERRVSTPRSS